MSSLTTKSTKDEILAAAEKLNVNLADLSNYRLNATKETAIARIREAEQSTSPRATPRAVVDSDTPVGTRLGRGAARVVDLSDTTPMPQPNFATQPSVATPAHPFPSSSPIQPGSASFSQLLPAAPSFSQLLPASRLLEATPRVGRALALAARGVQHTARRIHVPTPGRSFLIWAPEEKLPYWEAHP